MPKFKPLAMKVWRSLPHSVRTFLHPKILSVLQSTSTIFGFQFLRHPIGRVSVPYFAKSNLKRSFAQQGEDLILDRIITRVLGWDINQARVYVDVGAYDAIDHSVTYLLYLRGWRGVVFDPSSKTRKSFKYWRKRDVFVNAVVGEQDGIDVDFFVPKGAAGDQSLVSTKYPSESESSIFEKTTHRQVNLNDELKRQGIQKVDVLNIDVEGAELEILKTLDFEYFQPSIIAVEIHGNDIVKCLEADEARLIMSKGYQAVGSAVITQFFVRKSEIPD